MKFVLLATEEETSSTVAAGAASLWMERVLRMNSTTGARATAAAATGTAVHGAEMTDSRGLYCWRSTDGNGQRQQSELGFWVSFVIFVLFI